MLLYNNRKAHLFSLSDVPIYNSILILLQAPPVTVYKPLFFYVSSTILMTAYILQGFYSFSFIGLHFHCIIFLQLFCDRLLYVDCWYN